MLIKINLDSEMSLQAVKKKADLNFMLIDCKIKIVLNLTRKNVFPEYIAFLTLSEQKIEKIPCQFCYEHFEFLLQIMLIPMI